MTNPLLKILWLEDEPDKNPNFIDEAYDEGLELSHVKTIREALTKLRNPHEFEGAIYDAKGIKDDNEIPSLQRIHYALTETAKLTSLPIVIYTGQKGDSDEWKEIADNIPDEVQTFLKGKEKDQMFKHLKTLIEKQPEKLVRKKYFEIYEFCNQELGPESWPALLHSLLHIKHDRPLGGFKPYNDLRQIIEQLCQAYGAKGLIPKELYHDSRGQVNANYCVRFLAGNDYNYSYLGDYPNLPEVFTTGILGTFRRLLNDGSHSDSEEKALIAPMEGATNGNHHLVHILTYLTIDLLRIAKGIFEQYSDPDENRKLWGPSKTNPKHSKKGTLKWSGNSLTVNLVDENAEARLETEEYRKVKELQHGQNVEVELKINDGYTSPKYVVTKILVIDSNETNNK